MALGRLIGQEKIKNFLLSHFNLKISPPLVGIGQGGGAVWLRPLTAPKGRQWAGP
jgi:hypothetical protein